MKALRVRSPKTGKAGWRYRVSINGRRLKKTFWIADRRDAEKALERWLSEHESKAIGLPDHSGLKMSYKKLVERFIAEFPFSSDARKSYVQKILERNECGIQIGADLSHVGRLTAKCLRIKTQRGDHYTVFAVQSLLKQLSRWAASIGLLPFDYLSAWKRLPWQGHRRRRAFVPEEAREILRAAADYDQLFGHPYPSWIIFETLLLSGNRPGAVFSAKVGDLLKDRIKLPPGTGKKRNGMCTLPPDFIKQLHAHLEERGSPTAEKDLLVSHKGKKLWRVNMGEYFRRSMVLAFVRLEWPRNDPLAAEIDPFEVAHCVFMGRARGFDGAPPKDPFKLVQRKRKLAALEALVAKVGPLVKRRLEGADMYALRKTHITWARRLTNIDSVKAQVGHAAGDAEERHYLDLRLVDAGASSKAVWEVLTGTQNLAGERQEAIPFSLAAGAEESVKCLEMAPKVAPGVAPLGRLDEKRPGRGRSRTSQPVGKSGIYNGAGEGARTLDFDLGKKL
ncbi:MAG: hypothetical protein L6Q80_09245 [Dehalococcoidia bacterium]|nr:hypothetical protein [Planctomycetota bacterium]MCK6564923.1 hypothetical protein [Dehalococcoidia bacterium]